MSHLLSLQALRTMYLLLLLLPLMLLTFVHSIPELQQDCSKFTGKKLTLSASQTPQNMAFLIGVQKSGTTFLFNKLVASHPDILSQLSQRHTNGRIMSIKEPQFFSKAKLGSLTEYIKMFHAKRNPYATYIDATPSYINTVEAAPRIAAAFPKAKLLVVLRDPAKRALSAWNMNQFRGQNVLKFHEEVEDELRVLREIGCSYEPKQSSNFTSKQEDNWVRAPGMPAWNDCFPCIFYDNCWGQKDSSFCLPSLKRSFLRRGFYVYQLEWWMKHFDPSQMLVINYEELKVDEDAVVDRVHSFLGLDPKRRRSKAIPAEGFSTPYKNKTLADSKTSLAMQLLNDVYAHANQELYRLMASLGPSIGWRGTFEGVGGNDLPDESYQNKMI